MVSICELTTEKTVEKMLYAGERKTGASALGNLRDLNLMQNNATAELWFGHICIKALNYGSFNNSF